MATAREETGMERSTESNSQTMFPSGNQFKKSLKLSPAEQILAGTNQQQSQQQQQQQQLPQSSTYFTPPGEKEGGSLFNPYLFPTSNDVSSISRSMTALGLSNTIPEEPTEMELSDSDQLQNASRIASKSAIDLVGLNEDEVFDVTAEGEKAFGAISDSRHLPNSTDLGFSLQITLLPSRCIMISNLSPLLSDDQLRLLFQNFGDIQSIRSEYRMQGVVQVAYYDIRSAVNAKDQLNGVQLSDQRLNVQFAATPGSVGSFTEGTLLVFNIDPALDATQLAASFLPYGEVRRVHSIPEKQDYRLVEFYDIRHSNAAMNALNAAAAAAAATSSKETSPLDPLAGIKQTMSLHNLALGQKSTTEGDEDQSSRSWDGSAHAMQHMETLMGLESTGLSPSLQSPSSGMTKSISFGSGLCDQLQQQQQHQQSSSFDGQYGGKLQSHPPTALKGAVQLTAQLAAGLKLSDNASTNLGPTSPGLITPLTKTGTLYQTQNPLNRANLSYSASVGTGLDTYGHQAGAYGNLMSSMDPSAQSQGVGNLPGVNPAQLGQILNYSQNPSGLTGNTNVLQTLAMAQAAGLNVFEVLSKIPGVNLGQLLNQSTGSTDAINQSSGNVLNLLNPLTGPNTGPGSLQSLFSNSVGGVQSRPNASSFALGQSSGLDGGGGTGSMCKSASSPALHVRGEERSDTSAPRNSGGRLCRKNVDPVIEAERQAQQKRLYGLDPERIRNGEDKRTTLMIKNIPNKYTQKMLLASIDETLRGTYDFFYLPIDFKNKCNVGYGFINMREPADIIPLVQRFDGKRWEKFNSEKICSIAYGRIQGKQALINHFQNSSLMHEDKKHRPVLFVTDGPNKGDPEPFPVGTNIRPKITYKERDFRSRDRSGGGGHWPPTH
eukprot:g6565.t1